MEKEFPILKKLPLYAGLTIPIWLTIGVAIAGALYPGYSHINQAMSELGARGAPTHSLSPLINNYPLGLLFLLCGLGIVAQLKPSRLAVLSGLLVMAHGLGSMAAGYFPCDAGCQPETPSTAQLIHNLSGLAMMLSLIIANALWIFLGRSLLNNLWLSLFSTLCLLSAIGILAFLPTSAETGQGFGLIQRINYGASTLWLAGVALTLLRRQRPKSAVK